jgi:hypothetical protein
LGLVALLLVGGLLTAWLTNSIGADPRENRAAPATTRIGAGAGPTEDQAAPPTTRNGAGATATTQPTPATTKQPVTTQAPTTPTTAAIQRGLPASWRPFTNRTGNNRVGVPPGFRARTRQRYNATVVEEQDDPRRVFTVRSQIPSAPLPQASRDYRAWARRNFAGFREVRYAEHQTYAGHKGAVVFECEAVRDGRRVHVSHINVKGRTWGYNIELATTSSSSSRPANGTTPRTWPASSSRPSSRSADILGSRPPDPTARSLLRPQSRPDPRHLKHILEAPATSDRQGTQREQARPTRAIYIDAQHPARNSQYEAQGGGLSRVGPRSASPRGAAGGSGTPVNPRITPAAADHGTDQNPAQPDLPRPYWTGLS